MNKNHIYIFLYLHETALWNEVTLLESDLNELCNVCLPSAKRTTQWDQNNYETTVEFSIFQLCNSTTYFLMLVCFGECSLSEFHLPSQSAPSTLVFKKLGLFEDLKTTDYICLLLDPKPSCLLRYLAARNFMLSGTARTFEGYDLYMLWGVRDFQAFISSPAKK